MSLRYAILTALAERESSGAQLTRRFDRSIGFFWSATHQQIYRELERLRREGAIAESAMPATTERGQPRRFAITQQGRAELASWIAEVSDPSALRDSIMVRMRAAAVTGEFEALESSLLRHLEVHTRTLEIYRDIERRDFAHPQGAADALRQHILRGGLALEQTRATWCSEALTLLARLREDVTPPAE